MPTITPTAGDKAVIGLRVPTHSGPPGGNWIEFAGSIEAVRPGAGGIGQTVNIQVQAKPFDFSICVPLTELEWHSKREIWLLKEPKLEKPVPENLAPEDEP